MSSLVSNFSRTIVFSLAPFITQNFCGDAYVGCCDFETECDIDCIGVLVAGCVQPEQPSPPPLPTGQPSASPTDAPSVSQAPSFSLLPTPFPTVSLMPSLSSAPTTAPVVPPPPTESPTISPTMPMCTIAVNLGLCEEVAADQEFIPGCNCYVSTNTKQKYSHQKQNRTYPSSSHARFRICRY
jgi:hypothetical protein